MFKEEYVDRIECLIRDFSYDVNLEDYEKLGDMVRVDAYVVPFDKAEEYIADRELLSRIVFEIFGILGIKTELDFTGSEDGEAVVGLHEDGTIARLIHLDACTVDDLKEIIGEGEKIGENVIEYILCSSKA